MWLDCVSSAKNNIILDRKEKARVLDPLDFKLRLGKQRKIWKRRNWVFKKRNDEPKKRMVPTISFVKNTVGSLMNIYLQIAAARKFPVKL